MIYNGFLFIKYAPNRIQIFFISDWSHPDHPTVRTTNDSLRAFGARILADNFTQTNNIYVSLIFYVPLTSRISYSGRGVG